MVKTPFQKKLAVCARYGPASLQEFHRRHHAKRGSYKLATIALTRRLLVIIWLMLQEGVPFSSAFNIDLAERKKKRLAQELKRLVKLEKKYGNAAETLFKMIQNLHHKGEEITERRK